MTESEMYFDFLLHVIAADGEIDQQEVDFIIGAAEGAGVSNESLEKINSQIEQLKSGHKLSGFNELTRQISISDNPHFVLNLIKDSYAIASSDGEVDKRELQIILQLVSKLTPNAVERCKELIRWARQSIAIDEKGIEILTNISMDA